MALGLEQKKAIVAELTEVAKKSISVVAAEYRGLTVSQITDLRSTARSRGVRVGVYRNTLARRAFNDTHFACLRDALVGPLVLFFSQDEPGAAAKLLGEFIKKYERLQVRALAVDGRVLGPEALQAIASLPSRHEALTSLAVVLKAPLVKFVRTLNEPVAQFVRVLGQIRDQKQ